MTSQRRGPLRLAVAGVTLTTLLVAGCGNASPSVVAYVGGSRITQTQLKTAEAGVAKALPDQQVPVQAVINVLIAGTMAQKIAAENNIAITDSQRDALVTKSNLAPLLGVPEAKPLAYGVADQQITAEKLGAEKYLAAIKATDVSLNPRYGVLDPAQKVIASDQSGSLSKPGPSSSEPPQ
ncbi:MAG: hypothetical protein JWP61_2038 [Friedmanniella sp.]|nr:hypothetical protein [Friedmanniella sp.]